MRVLSRPEIGFSNGITITFRFPLSEREALKPLIEIIENYDEKKEYELTFDKTKKKRSMDANAYMWVLCDKIAKVIRSTKEEVYRKAIREVGVFSDIAVQEGEPCEHLIQTWNKWGIGYFAEMFDSKLIDKKGNPMKRVRLYQGSHEYSQEELSPVIDYIVEEAKNLNIEVLSDRKIKELEASWKN